MALALAPKFSAFASLCGSAIIVSKVVRSTKRRKQTMHRMMAAESISDVLVSVWFFASTWPIPAGTPSRFGDGTQPIFGAVGNDFSCSVAGFWNQFQVAGPLYNGTLATYFFLVAHQGWSDARIKRVEWMLIALPLVFATITSIFAVATDLMGEVEWTCWILPPEVFEEGVEPTPIQSHFQLIQWLFLFGPVWVCIIYVSVIFYMLFRKMRSIEDKMNGYAGRQVTGSNDVPSGAPGQDGVGTRTSSQSQKIAKQGMHYAVGFFIAWLFPTISRFLGFAKAQSFAVQLLDTFFIGMQGTFNCIIYLEPEINKHRRLDPESGYFGAFKATILARD